MGDGWALTLTLPLTLTLTLTLILTLILTLALTQESTLRGKEEEVESHEEAGAAWWRLRGQAQGYSQGQG